MSNKIVDPIYAINGDNTSRLPRERMDKIAKEMKKFVKELDLQVSTTVITIEDMKKMAPKDIPTLMGTPTTGKTMMALNWLKKRADSGDGVFIVELELDWDRFSTPEEP